MIEKIKKEEKKEAVIYEKTNPWTEEEISPLIGNMLILKNTDNLKSNPDDYKKRSFETLDEIEKLIEDNNGQYQENISEIYNKYGVENPVIVRREDPTKLSRLINGEDLEIFFDPNVSYSEGEKYANSALWPYGPTEKTSGIANAFLEGRGNAGPIVMLAGYKKDGRDIEIVKPEENKEVVGTLERHSVRILSGKIHKEDLEFVIIRIASMFFDKNKMTPKELERFNKGEQKQIFRGFSFK